MKTLLILTVLAFPIGVLAQGNIQVQSQGVNYNDLTNTDNNDNHPVQTNLGNQASPAEQQEGGSALFGTGGSSDAKTDKPCSDCAEVKAAIKASKGTSSGGYHRKTSGIKKWSKRFSARMHTKMRKTFSGRKIAKSNYGSCFSWS